MAVNIINSLFDKRDTVHHQSNKKTKCLIVIIYVFNILAL